MPGKPRCRVTSRLPTSTPSSSAFVAHTAHRSPSSSARSISRRSCEVSAHNRQHVTKKLTGHGICEQMMLAMFCAPSNKSHPMKRCCRGDSIVKGQATDLPSFLRQ